MADRLKVTDLDFDTIKLNLKNFLKQQTEFQDYDFEGAGLSVLVDLLAYNTHYNAYYLNMVANESFLDTALLRDSVVSHAKSLGYIPFSVNAAKATVNVTIDADDNTPESLTIPKGYRFISGIIDGRTYNFVTLEDVTITKANTDFTFENIDIYQGQLVTYRYEHSLSENPKSIFKLQDENIDTKTLKVSVSPSSSNTSSAVYNVVTDIFDVDNTSEVFFIQEGRDGKYEIYFGDGKVGKKLPDGAIVNVEYLVTSGSIANKATDFVASSALGAYNAIRVDVTAVASGGSSRETVDSIKYSAPSQFTTQNRLVTFRDYESYIKKNYPSVDSLSVWGGEDEVPKVYGKVFISLKPKQNYYISETEKSRIIEDIIKPKSIVGINVEIRDPNYLYLKTTTKIKYEKRKTTNNVPFLLNASKNSVLNYNLNNLNKFGALFVVSKLQDEIDSTDGSFLGSETRFRLEKRFEPRINEVASYTIDFNTPLHRGTVVNRMLSTQFTTYDTFGVLRNAQIEESAQSFTGIEQIDVTNPGYNYTSTPTVTITGDGFGATAEAVIVNGRLNRIDITNRGTNYTRAVVTITGGGGVSASASALATGRIGTLRVIYFDANAEKQVINSDVGSINYDTGYVTINNLRIVSLSSSDGLMRLDVESDSDIIQSERNTIITIDENDPTAIALELEAI
jgi:hypothetical protein